MPVLDFPSAHIALPVCDALGHFRAEDISRVLATMIWPDDAALRYGFESRIATEVAARLALRKREVFLDPTVLLASLDAEPHPLAPGGNLARWQEGEMAGEQLLWLFSLSLKAPQHASHKRVIFLMEEHRAQNGRPGRRATFHKAWAEYSSVAHFWAALLATGGAFRDFSSVPGFERYTALVDFEGMLRNAAAIWDWRWRHSPVPASPWLMPTHWRPTPWRSHWLPWHGAIKIDDWVLGTLARYPHGRAVAARPGPKKRNMAGSK